MKLCNEIPLPSHRSILYCDEILGHEMSGDKMSGDAISGDEMSSTQAYLSLYVEQRLLSNTAGKRSYIAPILVNFIICDDNQLRDNNRHQLNNLVN